MSHLIQVETTLNFRNSDNSVDRRKYRRLVFTVNDTTTSKEINERIQKWIDKTVVVSTRIFINGQPSGINLDE